MDQDTQRSINGKHESMADLRSAECWDSAHGACGGRAPIPGYSTDITTATCSCRCHRDTLATAMRRHVVPVPMASIINRSVSVPDPRREEHRGNPPYVSVDYRSICLSHLEPEPCSTCMAYIAAGL